MSDPSAPNLADSAVGPVVESFLARYRKGERPSLTELVARHPDLAEQLQEIIPALVELEQLGSSTGSISGPRTGSGDAIEANHPGTLGGYKILRWIGGGGMGVVYEAEHESLKSRVALKVMHPRFRADEKYLRRFHIEARAAAGLHHTNIVSVFDYGEQGGVCYYAMQCIRGQPLDSVISDLRRLRAEGRNPISPGFPGAETPPDTRAQPSVAAGLMTGRFVSGESPDDPLAETRPIEGPAVAEPETPHKSPSVGSTSLSGPMEGRYYREVARVCEQVADALDYAHRAGVLHRDIKPSNLLLDALGNVWVTDFGLAKLEGGEDVSKSQDLVGTLRYMAPERFRGISDRSGDVYALGATLYELATLRPAFDGTDQIRLIDRIVHEPPEHPRLIDRHVPRDLETIVLKALAKEPMDRFGSAREMAEELRRFVSGHPIQSRPISIVERFYRWSKRNPWLAAANIAAAAATMALAIGSTAFALRLGSLNTQLRTSVQAESKAKTKAEQARDKFQALATAAFKQNKAVLETHRSMSILLNQRLRQVEGTQGVRAELSNETLKNIRNYLAIIEGLAGIVEDKEGELITKRTLAGINLQAGRLAVDYERDDEAGEYFKQVDKLAEELVSRFPKELEPLKVLAVSKGTLGGFQLDQLGDGKAALELFRRTLEIRREILKRLPNDDEARRGVCNALGAIARSYLKLGDPKRAREIYREELGLRDQFSEPFRSVVEVRRERAGVEEKLGDVCLDLNDLPAARGYYERSLGLREAIAEVAAEDTQSRRDVFLSIRKIATVDLFDGKPADARVGYEKALAEFRRRLIAEPASLSAKQDVALTEYYVGTACLRLKDLKAADEHYRACLALREAMAADPKLRLNTIDLMIIRARCGQHEVASKTARELCEKPPLDARVYYQAACGFALCAGDVTGLPASAEKAALARQYTNEAFKALRMALDSGWKNLGDLQNDPDLDAIRGDRGFTAVLDDFRKASSP